MTAWLVFALIGFLLADSLINYFNKKRWKKEMIKEITKGLARKIVIIEGRCSKCDERIPDDLITPADFESRKWEIN